MYLVSSTLAEIPRGEIALPWPDCVHVMRIAYGPRSGNIGLHFNATLPPFARLYKMPHGMMLWHAVSGGADLSQLFSDNLVFRDSVSVT
ncbi:hypothetical protein [Streptomyces sp. NPDC023838]|uniref:hypothetical protein n=1 Tax=Streptomyces sp. NPDC023838 TaxID=3154325 RepID=UPI0033CD623B